MRRFTYLLLALLLTVSGAAAYDDYSGFGFGSGFSNVYATLTDTPEPTDTNGIVICADKTTYAASQNAIECIVDRANDAVVLTKKVAGVETELLNETVDPYGSELSPDENFEDIDTGTSYAISSITAADPPVMTVDTSGLTDLFGGQGDCSTDWAAIKQTGWSYDGTNDEYDCDGSQTGNSNVSFSAGTITLNKIYEATFTVKNRSAGGVTPVVGGYATGTRVEADGTYTQYITPTNPSSNDNLVIVANASFVGSIDDLFIKELPFVEGDYVTLGGFGEQLGTDLLSGWDFDDGSWTESNATANGDDNFTTSAAYGKLVKGVLTSGKYYKCVLNATADVGNVRLVLGNKNLGEAATLNDTYYTDTPVTSVNFEILGSSNGATVTVTTLEVYEVIPVDANIYPLANQSGATFELLGADLSDRAPLVYDTFTDSNGTLLAAHTPDTDVSGAGWTNTDGFDWDIQSNVVGSNSNGNTVITAAADGVITASMKAGTYDSISFRYDDSDNCWLFQARGLAADEEFRIWKIDGGAATIVAQGGTCVIGNTYEVAISFVGSNITASVDGVQLFTVSDSYNQTETKIGVRGGSGTSATIDNLTFTDIVNGYAAVSNLGSFVEGEGWGPKVDVEPENLVTNGDFSDVTLAAAKGVTGITKANPGVVTFDAGHGYVDGDIIYFSGLTEMTELNGEYWKLRNNSGDTFELSDAAIATWDTSSLDTSGYGAAETTGGNCAQKATATTWASGGIGQLDVDGAGALTGKYAFDGTDTSGQIWESGIISSNTVYNYSFLVTDYVQGAIRVRLDSSTYGPSLSANGLYLQALKTGAWSNATINIASTPIMTIDIVRVRKISETYAHCSGEQSGSSVLNSDVSSNIGSRYEHTTVVTTVDSSFLQPYSGTFGSQISSTGTDVQDIVAPGSGSHRMYASSSFIGSISSWSIKEVESKELIVLKDDTKVNVWYDGSRVGTEQTVSDSSVVNRKRHYQTGDGGGTFSADRLTFGSDLLAGWDFNNWTGAGTPTINNATTFTTASTGGVYKNVGLQVGIIYKLPFAGTTTAPTVELRNAAGGATALIGSGFGTYYYMVSVADWLYVRNTGAGQTSVTTLELYEVNP